MMIIQYLLIAFLSFITVYGTQWPIPYERVTSRPTNNPYCQAGLITFCPTGKTEDAMVYAEDDDDIIEIFALKKPVWSFKFGDLMAKFKVMHDALGFRSQKTGLNWTMEWYELDQLFNCTFPHVLRDDSFIWCNQGALCVYEGIVDSLWNGTSDLSMLKKVGQTSGKNYNAWASWAVNDNNTGVYYETWSVYSDNGPNATIYFDSYDCASFVIRGLNQLYRYGAEILPNIHLNYTRINLYAYEPQLLGTYNQIIQNKTLHKDFINFYREFDSKKPTTEDWIKSLLEIYETFFISRRFYLYFNNVYWYMRLKETTPLKITFYEIPIGSILKNEII
ncbi:unnamed protein product [Rotaria sordida]|uniref:Bis(monoacylglycero)phosphate synthase CLN5 n=1 Tax=Rotaria sordida TaxID=392033 RepID=A0A815PT15_9BILA|nr:unnamed protein product [Rotaria sordida]